MDDDDDDDAALTPTVKSIWVEKPYYRLCSA